MEKGSKAFGTQQSPEEFWMKGAEISRSQTSRISQASPCGPHSMSGLAGNVCPSLGGTEVAAQECREQQSSLSTVELLVLAMDVFVDSL